MNTIPELGIRARTQSKCGLAMRLGVLLFCLAAGSVAGQSYKILHTFGASERGANPYSKLVQGPDGALYGTTEIGGAWNRGQVFKVNPDGSGYTALQDFNGTNGAYPQAGLVLSGVTLYGTTCCGGNADNGTVFRVNTDGSGFALLADFADAFDGVRPSGSVVLSGTTLYGVALEGGATWNGTVFKVETDGTGFAVLKHFTGYDGAYPRGSLALSGTTLYGTTETGGGGDGTVFKVETDGSGFQVLKVFRGGEGGGPLGGLVLSDSTLYGTTQWGGDNGNASGTVFKLGTDGSGFTVLKAFSSWAEGAYPAGELLLSGTNLFGTTLEGGAESGTVFKLNTDGTGFTVLRQLTNAVDGARAYAGLILSGATLFGAASEGGSRSGGTLFNLETDGGRFGVIAEFGLGDGQSPESTPVVSGTTVYGTTVGGGSWGEGTVYKINTDGSGYTVLKEFNWSDGATPKGGLLLSGATLYGTTLNGGSSEMGTVFRINTDGSGFEVLKHFTNWYEGANPYSRLALSGGTLYGTTEQGGSFGRGTVFKLSTNGGGYTVLNQFKGSDGIAPYGDLVLSGATLCGTTWSDENSWNGTVYKLDTDGTGYTILKHFVGSDGANPYAGLALSGTTLLGTTVYGGSQGAGTAFRLETDGTGFTVIRNFEWAGGGYPSGGLALSNTTLYGMAQQGGLAGYGTVFRMETNGSGYTVLKQFTGNDGGYPNSGLALDGTTVYGTTSSGGQNESGVLFSLSLVPGAPEIHLQPQSQSAQSGWPITMMVIAAGIPAPACQWYFNGTNTIPGATNGAFELEVTNRSQAGEFSVILTNDHGSVTSAVAVLTVLDPYVNGPGSQYARAGDAIQVYADAGGTEPVSYQWYRNGAILSDDENISGTLSPTLSFNSVSAADMAGYTLVVSNEYGSVTSAVMRLWVADPFIDGGPDDWWLNAGDTAEFNVSGGASAPWNCQWFKDGLALSDGGNISGSQTFTLTLTNVSIADAGAYSMIVSNCYGVVASLTAALTVQDPFILDQSWDQTAVPWQAVQFGVTAGGTEPISYQWRKNGTPLSEQTGALLTLPGVQLGDAGNYDVVVNNANGSVTSSVVVLTVNLAALDSFNPAANVYVGALATQPDGRILAGGAFTGLGGLPCAYLGRLNPDGALDTSFSPDVNSSVSALAVQPDGKILAGGWFSFVGGQARNRIARLNPDGTLDTAFNPGANSAVLALAVQPDGRILVGGEFTMLGGQTRNRIARLNPDGTLDTGFNPEADGSVVCMQVQPGGKIIVGGYFASLCGQPRLHIGRLNPDGTLDEDFNPGANSVVLTLSLQSDGKILAGGNFYELGGQPHAYIGRLNPDGTVDSGFDAGADNFVHCLAIEGDNKILLGGYFTQLGATNRSRLGRLNADGTVDPTFNPGANNLVSCLALQPDGNLIVGGLFTYLGGQPRDHIARVLLFELPGMPDLTTGRTAEAGSTIELGAITTGKPEPGCQWFFNGDTIPDATNAILQLADLQYAQSGSYVVVLTNAAGAVTSSPAPLNVIAPVEHRLVPGINVIGEPGGIWNVYCTENLGAAGYWLSLETVSLAGTSQFCFDLSAPLPPQRFYRAWQADPPSPPPSLTLNFVPVITLTGNVNDVLRLDGINVFGPTDAWFTIDTVTLTNTLQLYFDVSAIGQPQRLYRITP